MRMGVFSDAVHSQDYSFIDFQYFSYLVSVRAREKRMLEYRKMLGRIKEKTSKLSSFLSNAEMNHDPEILKRIPECPSNYPRRKHGWTFPKVSKIKINGQYFAYSYRHVTHGMDSMYHKYTINYDTIVPVIFSDLKFCFISFISKSLTKLHPLLSKYLEKKDEIRIKNNLSKLKRGTASYEAGHYDILLVDYLRQELWGHYHNKRSFKELASLCLCYSLEEKRALTTALKMEELECI